MRHALRIALLTLALVLLGLALAPKATPAQEPGPCDSSLAIPYGWHLRPPDPCGNDSVTVVFTSCRDCVDLLGFVRPEAGPAVLSLRERVLCPLGVVCRPDSIEVPLGRLAAGIHQLNYVVSADVVSGDSVVCHQDRPTSLGFMVGCAEPPGVLPYVSTIQVGATSCAGCPPRICPAQPIPFSIAGVFNDGCYRFRGLELLPSPLMGPRPEPPIVRLYVERRTCGPCTLALVPWSADTVLAGLMPGDYRLMMQMVVSDYCDSLVTIAATYQGSVAFTVKDSCLGVPVEPCFLTDWVHPGTRCDAFIVPGGSATSVMTLVSPVRLAGLQGRLSLSPPGLRISHLEPVGAAQGMHLAWTPKPDGAEFVLFAEAGAPLGGVRCDVSERCQQPILEVTAVPDTDGVPAAVTYLTASGLLGADSLGRAVQACPIMTLAMVASRICAGPSCDFNRDGSLDVRDLVSMVHCVLGSGPCPDTSLAGLDCNRDGRTGVDDVLCCARAILHGGERDTAPGRPEKDVAVGIGAPEWAAGGLRVPLRVTAADRVGAARLALALPLDRYEVTGVETGAGAGQWLELHEVVDGQLVVGLIGLDPDLPAGPPTTLDLTLRLALKPGQSAGGEVGLADLQLSGRDGVTLVVATTPAPVELPAPGALLLSAARPNPFTHETSFALNLDRAADVDLAVHDLGGRRVATLFHGALGAGPHEFTWRGARSDGSTAANGIYFLQARVGAERLARKVIFLRGN